MLLHMDGFDEYSSFADMQMEYFTIANGDMNQTSGRYGGGGWKTSVSVGVARALPTNPTELWTGIAIKPVFGQNSGSDFTIFSFIGDNGECVYITYNYVTSLFRAWRVGSPNVVLGFEAILFVPEAWHWFEVRCKLGTGTSGIVEIWLDNVRILNITGIATNPNGSASFTTMAIGSIARANTAFVTVYDDWYILDTSGAVNNTRLGDSRIETRIPVSDAGPNDGTPSTPGDHFAMLNAVPWSNANTVTLANTDGQEELFNMTPLVSNPASIFACRALTIMEKTDGGTMTGATVTKSAAVSADGPTTPGLNVWCHIEGIQELDPNTSAAWTTSAVNASQVGFKIVV